MGRFLQNVFWPVYTISPPLHLARLRTTPALHLGRRPVDRADGLYGCDDGPYDRDDDRDGP
jgi:hypothetical protein